MGLRPFDYLAMTPREFSDYAVGFRRRRQYDYQENWERVRWLAWSNQRVAGGKVKTPKEYATFPWERKFNRHSKEERERREKLAQKLFPDRI